MAALLRVTLHPLVHGEDDLLSSAQIAGNAPNCAHLCSSAFPADVEQAPAMAFHG